MAREVHLSLKAHMCVTGDFVKELTEHYLVILSISTLD